MSALRERYFKTLGLSADDPVTESKLGKALDRAYELRTFEIEHYWKRATYFWGFQIAIFAAFGLLWRESNLSTMDPWTPITVALSGLGVLTAVANYLSARGSKFWQQNWESHIDMLEDEIEGRLHKTVWLSDRGTSFSVSRINEWLSFFFILFWIGVTLYVAIKFVGFGPPDFLRDIRALWLFLVIVAAIAVGAMLLVRQKTRLLGTRPKEDGCHGEQFEQCSCWYRRAPKSPAFIRRYVPDELPQQLPGPEIFSHEAEMAPAKPNVVSTNGLVGRSFHVFGDDGAVRYLGTVVAQAGREHYLVQYFEWLSGQESTLAIIPLSDMACSPKNSRAPWTWQFYKDDAHMNEWYKQYGEGLKAKAAVERSPD